MVEKHRNFVQAYLQCFDAAEAARRAQCGADALARPAVRRELAAQTGLPVRCTLVREELYPTLKGRLPAPFPVKILVRQPWQKELPRQGQE